jgi:hypothetical protein
MEHAPQTLRLRFQPFDPSRLGFQRGGSLPCDVLFHEWLRGELGDQTLTPPLIDGLWRGHDATSDGA